MVACPKYILRVMLALMKLFKPTTPSAIASHGGREQWLEGGNVRAVLAKGFRGDSRRVIWTSVWNEIRRALVAGYAVGEAGAMEFNAVFAGVCAVLKEGRRVREEKVEKVDGWTKEGVRGAGGCWSRRSGWSSFIERRRIMRVKGIHMRLA